MVPEAKLMGKPVDDTVAELIGEHHAGEPVRADEEDIKHYL